MSKSIKNLKSAALGVLLSFNAVFATSNTYAKNAGEWVLDGLFWLVLVAGIFTGAMAAIRRNALAALGIFVATAIVAVIIKDPNVLVTLGNNLKGIFGL